jgi:hypothetical protein
MEQRLKGGSKVWKDKPDVLERYIRSLRTAQSEPQEEASPRTPVSAARKFRTITIKCRQTCI